MDDDYYVTKLTTLDTSSTRGARHQTIDNGKQVVASTALLDSTWIVVTYLHSQRRRSQLAEFPTLSSIYLIHYRNPSYISSIILPIEVGVILMTPYLV